MASWSQILLDISFPAFYSTEPGPSRRGNDRRTQLFDSKNHFLLAPDGQEYRL